MIAEHVLEHCRNCDTQPTGECDLSATPTYTLSRAASTATLARTGWSHVYACFPSAPHAARFERVAGGWRPRVHGSPTARSDAKLQVAPWESQLPPAVAPAIGIGTKGSMELTEPKPLCELPPDAATKMPQAVRTKGTHAPGPPNVAKPPLWQCGRAHRREPQFSQMQTRWTARIQGNQKCRARPCAPCIDLAIAMTANAQRIEAATAGLVNHIDLESPKSNFVGPLSPTGCGTPSHHHLFVDCSSPRHLPAEKNRTPTPEKKKQLEQFFTSTSSVEPELGTASAVTETAAGKRQGKKQKGSKRDLDVPFSRPRRMSNIMIESKSIEIRAKLHTDKVRGTPNSVWAVQEFVEQLKESQTRNLLLPADLKAREMRESKVAHYVQELVREPNVVAISDRFQIDREELAELAQLFAEFDGKPRGFIGPSSLRTVLRRMGRPQSAWGISELLDALWSTCHNDEDRCERFLQDLDFPEIVEVLGIVIERDKANLKQHAGQLVKMEHGMQALLTALKGLKLGFTISYDHLNRTAKDLGVRSDGQPYRITLKDEATFLQLVHKCRHLEKIHAHETAGFVPDEVAHFHKAYNHFVPQGIRGEMRRKDISPLLEHLHIISSKNTPEQHRHMSDVLANAEVEVSGTISFTQSLHLVRRLYDETEVFAVLLERTAQDLAEFSSEDVEQLRQLFENLRDSEQDQDFNFPALTKAVRLVGGDLTSSDACSELQNIFNIHALPSRQRDKVHLTFPNFMQLMAKLWSQDFAGMMSTSEAWANAEALKENDNTPLLQPTGLNKSVLARLLKPSLNHG